MEKIDWRARLRNEREADEERARKSFCRAALVVFAVLAVLIYQLPV